MATEITEFGYQLVRDYIESDWNYIEIIDENSNPIMRLSTDDERVHWAHDPGDQILVLSVGLSGSDPDLALPKVVTGSVIYHTEISDNPIHSDGMPAAEMNNEADTLTINHRIYVPQL